jgi:hypothetical protein
MIQLTLPPDARQIGALYSPSDDPRYLEDDMLQVDFSGLTIHVGWDPEHEINGEYLVTLYSGRWDNQLHFFTTRDDRQVKSYIEDTFRRSSTKVSSANKTTIVSSVGVSPRNYDLAGSC